MQAGNAEDRGVGLSANYNKEFFNKELNWNSIPTCSRNANEIKELTYGYRNPLTGQLLDTTEVCKGGTVLREGGSTPDITVRGILSRNKNGEFIEETAQCRYDQMQEIKLGRSTPDFQMG